MGEYFDKNAKKAHNEIMGYHNKIRQQVADKYMQNYFQEKISKKNQSININKNFVASFV
jgi:hypothetical protein